MKRLILLVAVVSLVLATTPIATADPATGQLTISTTKAPIAPDGVTAGAPTDFVITFIDADPSHEGLTLAEGGTITVELPSSFVNVGGAPNFGVLLQGWPQSPPAGPPAFIWTSSVDDSTLTMTMDQDWAPDDFFGPGAKQVHLVLLGFRNPGPGSYPVKLTIQPDLASPNTLVGEGSVRIIPKVRPSVNAVSVFSGAPGPPPPLNNAIYQSVAAGDTGLPVGLYLWDTGGEPMLGVDLQMQNPTHGRLVQDGRTVGSVKIDAPAGASGFALSTDGPSGPGVSFLTSLPVGVLLTEFTTGPDATGRYEISISVNNGNTQSLFVDAG